ncbi:MAG: response regulator [Candidatus Omnitrophota bacterium]|nr:MAG: response regulator [Candidatus Omnitrophota bacterium]
MKKKKILLVDDEPQLVDTLKLRLEANDYEVVIAYDGNQALERVRSEQPDLIVLDLLLPKLDGYTVCGLLKRDSKHAHIPIVMLTARTQEADIKMGKEVGADEYITKPFEPKILLEKISNLLGG